MGGGAAKERLVRREGTSSLSIEEGKYVRHVLTGICEKALIQVQVKHPR